MLAGVAAPISLLESCATQGNYHLALSHLILDNEEYREFYQQQSWQGVLVGVDNGVVEQGKSLPVSMVAIAAGMVDAKEFILPDVLGDGQASYEATVKGLDAYQHLMIVSPNFKLIAVPHGSNVADWMMCYLRLLQVPEVNIIGVSMFDSDLFQGGRVGLLDSLEDMGFIDPNRQYHMLGCWRDLREAYGLSTRCQCHEYSQGWYVQPRTYVRSMDTGLPVRWGIQGTYSPRLTEPVPPPVAGHRHADFLTPVQMNPVIQWNIDQYKDFCVGRIGHTLREDEQDVIQLTTEEE